jgi:predicted nucleic-acid-binding Zn-ribbon protein
MTAIIPPQCPKCTCSDIRSVPFKGYVCFKCGYTEPFNDSSKAWSNQEATNAKNS